MKPFLVEAKLYILGPPFRLIVMANSSDEAESLVKDFYKNKGRVSTVVIEFHNQTNKDIRVFVEGEY